MNYIALNKTARYFGNSCLVLPLIFLLQTRASYSQVMSPKQSHVLDSLKLKLQQDSTHIFRFQKFRPYANIDTRNSFIKKAPINVFGLQLGTIINEKHVVGLGAYKTNTQVRQAIITTKDEKKISTKRNLDMSYLTAFYQYVLLDKRYIEIDLPAEAGYGQYHIQSFDMSSGNKVYDKTAGMFLVGVGPMITIKPLRWVGISGMAGYRFTFEKNPNLNFNGAYFSYGLWLDIRQIIRDTRYYVVKKPRYKKQIKQLFLQ